MTTTTGLTSRESAVLGGVRTGLFIGGEWRPGSEGVIAVDDPSTTEPIAEVADASVADAPGRARRRRRRPGAGGPRPRRATAARSCAAPSS